MKRRNPFRFRKHTARHNLLLRETRVEDLMAEHPPVRESGGLSVPLRYYCTAGKGMEQFLAEEVHLKLSASDVHYVSGKVFFTTSADIQKVVGLKSAERLFLLLKREAPLSDTWSAGQAARVVQERIIGEHQAWSSALQWWQNLRQALGEVEADQNTIRRGQKRKWFEGEGPLPLAPPPGVLEGERHLAGAPASEEGEVTSTQKPVVTFRVCCRCSGTVARKLGSQDLGRLIGTAISRQLRWKVELREPKVEVNVHLTDDHCVIGMPILRLPLAQRCYIRTTGLRSTVAWAMASLADIKPGSLVLDPMCGVGTVLLEAGKEYQGSFFLGMDIDPSQLEKASENIRFAELSNSIELLQSSVTAIPSPSCSVEAVVCDVPFGRKFSSRVEAAALLPAAVKEMGRVLRPGGTLVLLLSPQLSILLDSILSPSPTADCLGNQPGGDPRPLPSLQLSATYRVGLGATDGLIHKYRKMPQCDTRT
uniref:THUMP domain containing 2 n=2 Tax=Paramormyrops kingsleyae TaxID=1676925 RepID=A0A3B3QFQ2_9TELE